jgi:hypothetical protein
MVQFPRKTKIPLVKWSEEDRDIILPGAPKARAVVTYSFSIHDFKN